MDRARGIVRIGTREWPIQVGSAGDGAVNFEVLGELVEVRGDVLRDGTAGTIVVNGEVHSLTLESTSGVAPFVPTTPRASLERPPPARGGESEGRAVIPPMPGKVLEVRVRNGDRVTAGQVLLVVEAMKMRNDVASPVAGEVTGLLVEPGANVTARDVLLRVVPR